jgi:hypothetical protein
VTYGSAVATRWAWSARFNTATAASISAWRSAPASQSTASSVLEKGAARAIVARVVGTGSGSADSTRRGRLRPIRPGKRLRRSGAPSVLSTSTLSTSASADGLTR